MKKKLWMTMVACSLLFFMLLAAGTVEAEAELLPKPSNNLTVSLRRFSDIVPLQDGYMRVFYKANQVYVEYYDDNFKIKSRKTIAMELEYWGGFYAGKDAYYLVEGQKNLEENDDAEVIRVIRYDFNWNRVGAAKITGSIGFGRQVRYPFDYGCVEVTECNGKLYLVTGHEGYVDPAYNQGHQGFLMIEVDTRTMTGQIVAADLWHSFAQYIKSNGNDLYVLEQSEGSRYTKLSRYDSVTKKSESLNIFQYGGSRDSAWALPCYATVDGMALSADHILCVGTSIDQDRYDSASYYNATYNLYLMVTPMQDFSESGTKVNQLTYHTSETSFQGVKITKVNDNRFMISWQETNALGTPDADDDLSGRVLHYLFVNGRGDVVSREYTFGGAISDCQPVVKNSKVIYCASNEQMVNFYSIDSENGTPRKTSYRLAGENAVWDYSNGVLTISGTGEMYSGVVERYYGPEDERWTAVSNLVKKVVVKSGITVISEEAFAYLPKLEEVEIEPGVQKIGKKAFYACNNLRKITIPSSVVSIGEDFLWTGYYWMGSESHVVYADIYAPYDSFAVGYAKKNNIYYQSDISNANISGLKASYEYTGKAVVPEIKITLGGQTLKEKEDYILSWKNNKEVGKATLTVQGTGNLYGTFSKTFQIIKSSSKDTKKKISDAKVSGLKTSYTYTGKAITPEVKLTFSCKALKKDRDYTLTWKNNKNVGKATLTIKGKGSYSGTVTKTFQITKKSSVASAYSINKSNSTAALKSNPDKNASTLKIPSYVTISKKRYKVVSIGKNAFKNNKKLKTVSIPDTVTSIEAGAFQNCTALQKVVLGKNVKVIGDMAFANNTALRQVNIPSKTAKIGTKAFYNDKKLTSLTITSLKLSAKAIGSKAFEGAGKSNYKKLVVKVPKSKKSAYKKLLKSKGLSGKVTIK